MSKQLRTACVGVALVLVMGTAFGFETDSIPAGDGEVKITFIGHGTLMMQFGEKVVHIDPWTRLADYSDLPKADLILITHAHGDHADPEAITAVKKQGTIIVANKEGADKVGGAEIMANGDSRSFAGIAVEAVPAYNIVNKRESGEPFHPKDRDNGYVITLGGTRIYIAGDTENTPEMKALTDISVAFLPMNLPYTMNPEMVADAAKAFKPKVLYPYHYGETDPKELVKLLEGEDIEVRVRALR